VVPDVWKHRKVAFLSQTVTAIGLELNKNKVPQNRNQEKFFFGGGGKISGSQNRSMQMETCSSETSVDFQRTIRPYISVNRTLQVFPLHPRKRIGCYFTIYILIATCFDLLKGHQQVMMTANKLQYSNISKWVSVKTTK
jgi:hypothetical protein